MSDIHSLHMNYTPTQHKCQLPNYVGIDVSEHINGWYWFREAIAGKVGESGKEK